MTRTSPVRSTVRRTAAALGAVTLGAVAALAAAGPAQAAPRTDWAPAGEASIHPGVQMYTDGAQCTGNFVFTDDAGRTYVGYAAHCAGTGAATDTNGCEAASLPLGTKVDFVEGGSLAGAGTRVGGGELVYSSWAAMADAGETDENACAYNDFALVQVDAADTGSVNPSLPFWGGPTGIDDDGLAAGARVYSFGNSSLRAGIEALSPKTGVGLGDPAGTDGWTHPLYTLTPGVPGDSGSAFVDGDGKAIGTLSTLGLAPLPLSNNIGDLSRELGYAQAASGIAGLRLVEGTEPFSPIL